MQEPADRTFGKKERMTSRKLMEALFGGGRSRSMSAFPLRAVYMEADRPAGGAAVQVLVSVSKRHFKRAVMRNRVKRQIREAYRLNKHILTEAALWSPGKMLAVAFIWQAGELYDSRRVTESVASLLRRMAEKL